MMHWIALFEIKIEICVSHAAQTVYIELYKEIAVYKRPGDDCIVLREIKNRIGTTTKQKERLYSLNVQRNDGGCTADRVMTRLKNSCEAAFITPHEGECGKESGCGQGHKNLTSSHTEKG